jgi:hypothetical protein
LPLECTGYITPLGYKVLHKGHNVFTPAHRWMYEAYYGVKVSNNMEVMHICDNRKCIRPEHLRVGTHHENMLDAARKGRLHYSNVTHCKHGHEFTVDNTYTHPTYGTRRCKACQLRRSREQRERRNN